MINRILKNQSRIVKIAFILLLTFTCKTSVNEGDPDPNLVYYSGVYEIDLNKDGIIDLKSDIRYYDYSGKIITVFYLVPMNHSQILCDENRRPVKLSKGETIPYKPSPLWVWNKNIVNIMTCEYYRKNWLGSWAGATGFIGIKFQIDSTFHCGWVNITADTLRESNIIFNYSSYNPIAEYEYIIK